MKRRKGGEVEKRKSIVGIIAKATTSVGDSQRLSGLSMIGVPDLAYGPENANEMSSWNESQGLFSACCCRTVADFCPNLWQSMDFRYSAMNFILRHASISDSSRY